MKVMTWNLWGGSRWKKVVEFIQDNNIEIAGFQEVDNNLRRTSFKDIAKEIAKCLGYYWAYSPSIYFPNNAEFGNCIISKYPIIRSRKYWLSTKQEWTGDFETEPRTLLYAKIKLKQEIINFYTTHLGFSKNFETSGIKLKQVERLLGVISKERTVLLGDFNSYPETLEISKIRKHFVDTDNNNILKTHRPYKLVFRNTGFFPSKSYKIDYIFVSKDINFNSAKVVKNKISDHYPVIVDIET